MSRTLLWCSFHLHPWRRWPIPFKFSPFAQGAFGFESSRPCSPLSCLCSFPRASHCSVESREIRDRSNRDGFRLRFSISSVPFSQSRRPSRSRHCFFRIVRQFPDQILPTSSIKISFFFLTRRSPVEYPEFFVTRMEIFPNMLSRI